LWLEVAPQNQNCPEKKKAAMLLIALGPERSAEIFKHLKEDEIEQLTLEIANIRTVSPEDKERVLEEFYQICLAQNYIAEGGNKLCKRDTRESFGYSKGTGCFKQADSVAASQTV